VELTRLGGYLNAEAVLLVREGGRQPRKFAAGLGCSEESIRTWLEQPAPDAGSLTIHISSGQQFYSLPYWKRSTGIDAPRNTPRVYKLSRGMGQNYFVPYHGTK
jgi:hypothetical protein